MSDKIKKVLLVFLVALSLVSVLQGCRNAIEYSQDFQYDAAKVLSMGINPYDESLNPSGVLDSLGLETYYKQMEANQFPSLLFLLFPYIVFTPLMGRYVWLVSNMVCTGLILVLLRKTFFKNYSKIDYSIVALIMISGTPWRNQIGVGQHTLFSLMFFLLAVYFSEAKPFRQENANIILSGLSLMVSYFKYTLTVPLGLYFIYKRRYKELIISVIPHMILTVLAAVLLNDSIINMVLKPLKVANALTSEGSMDIGSLLGGGYFTMLLTVGLLVALLRLVYKMPADNDEIIIGMLTMWSLIITYHRIYDHFVMIIPFCIFGGFAFCNDIKSEWRKVLLWLLVASDFYVMRIFDSSGEVILPVIIVYYITTAVITRMAVDKVKKIY